MDSAQPPSLRSRLLQGFVGLGCGLTLYALSPGPVAYLAIRTDYYPLWIGGFYGPLHWVVGKTPMKVAMDKYLLWWSWRGYSHRDHQVNPPDQLRAPILDEP